MGWDKGYEIIEATIEEKLWYFQESDDGGFKFLDTYPHNGCRLIEIVEAKTLSQAAGKIKVPSESRFHREANNPAGGEGG